ncbi:MAG: BREX-1 system adenine-specific DNA-methyltransferase PglX [Anaerolineales bacterium]|nr:BREX-1 system adenine-specific DNA-methyltransferase PglX [Anaerolineales bacterium]
MNTKALEKFAQAARRQLQEQVAAKLAQVLHTDSAELRAQAAAVAALNKAIAASSRAAVVERVAYTWFNRFCALRYMDANGYTRIRAVSPAADFTQPELLQEAKAGHIDPDLAPFVASQRVFDLLAGRYAARDPQQTAYRLLLVGVCNQYHDLMPFMFEAIDDYTELLMPDDLLSAGSILQAVRDALSDEACQDVEVIGWLYQFYISEKKDAVIKAKKKITAENIPAATQLFTPNWIVRYLVQNSLGRLWLLNNPQSRLAEQMEFYIAPAEKSDFSQKSDFLRVNSPEALTVCDPAVGSGHMLTYAFDLLYAIYEEAGYSATQIPSLILRHNLFGLEIDERAGALAAFALMMKAHAKDRRFFRRDVRPNITVLESITFSEEDLETELAELTPLLAGEWPTQTQPQQPSLFGGEQQLRLSEASGLQELRTALLHDLLLFKEAKNVGSLVRPLLRHDQLARLAAWLESEATPSGNWLQLERRRRLLRVLNQAAPLARQYHIVIANPPYMGSKNQNEKLKKFLSRNYKDVKADVFSAFMIRNLELTIPKGQLAFVTPFVWMFISSYEKLRNYLLSHTAITNLVQLEYNAFAPAMIPVCVFTLENCGHSALKGSFIRLSEFRGAENQAPKTLQAIQNPACGYFYRAATTDFKKIPDSPIAYSVSDRVRQIFDRNKQFNEVGHACSGIQTGNNDLYLKQWFEINHKTIGFSFKSRAEVLASDKYWLPHKKGGTFRRWYGNCDYVINWKNDGEEIINNPSARPQNLEYMFRSGITWSHTSSSIFSVRLSDSGSTFNVEGPTYFYQNNYESLGLLASKPIMMFMKLLNPTLHFLVGNVSKLPMPCVKPSTHLSRIVEKLTNIARLDWDSYETSWNFRNSPLLQAGQPDLALAAVYVTLRQQLLDSTRKMRQLEEENNRIVIEAYGLQGELTPEAPLNEITLTCNPHYRYSSDKSEAELEALLLADTMREFISYAVGCMFGRYSLDKPGLILANQGETLADYLRQIPQPSFTPDKDNVIPLLDGDWFPDDIVERFKAFLRLTFGDDHYEENLAFIENAIGRDIRRYFLRDFYSHHLKMYKKRPIYWLFSSDKGSFNVLIYMHRYRPDTVSIILNDYLRDFRAKLTNRKSHLQAVSISTAAAQRDKTQALKEIANIDKTLKEISSYEDDVLYPLATQQLQIDLDDGVKVNYNKFGSALRKVSGLSR